jgi:hypothetical protein
MATSTAVARNIDRSSKRAGRWLPSSTLTPHGSLAERTPRAPSEMVMEKRIEFVVVQVRPWDSWEVPRGGGVGLICAVVDDSSYDNGKKALRRSSNVDGEARERDGKSSQRAGGKNKEPGEKGRSSRRASQAKPGSLTCHPPGLTPAPRHRFPFLLRPKTIQYNLPENFCLVYCSPYQAHFQPQRPRSKSLLQPDCCCFSLFTNKGQKPGRAPVMPQPETGAPHLQIRSPIHMGWLSARSRLCYPASISNTIILSSPTISHPSMDKRAPSCHRRQHTHRARPLRVHL